MPQIFENVAKEIIKEAISNAIFVDDRALEPYKGRSTRNHLKADHDRSKQLFFDFKLKNCALHIAKFSKSSWKRDRLFHLNNKDLLILDWQLVGDEHEESLKILDESVVRKSLHFCCIYTQAGLQEVRNEIIRYYLGQVGEAKQQEIREMLNDTLLANYWAIAPEDDDWVAFETAANAVINAREEDIQTELVAFRNTYQLTAGQMQQIGQIAQDATMSSSFVRLKTILSRDQGDFTKLEEGFKFRFSKTDTNVLYINHTIIRLFQKANVDGDGLYDAFVNSVIQDENSFLTLLGLEMRNRFRENSAFIGKDLEGVNEAAFFLHRKAHMDTIHIFEDFLREILKDQVASFLYEKEMKIFDTFEDYVAKKGIEAKIENLLLTANAAILTKEAYRLNRFYNLYNLNARKTNDLLRFGDVLKGNITTEDENGTEKTVEKFFICITALCDCLRPAKIKNQFWFVEGEVTETKVLEKTDGKFLSFVPSGNNTIAIDWEGKKKTCIPFAMDVTENLITKGIKATYFGRPAKLEWVASLKENYAQRIANEAFGHPIRVGIDFVKKK